MYSSLNSMMDNKVETITSTIDQMVLSMAGEMPNLDNKKERIDQCLHQFNFYINQIKENYYLKVDNLKNNLEFIGPHGTLKRGYAILSKKDSGGLVNSISKVGIGETLDVTILDGKLTTTVENIIKDAFHDAANSLEE
jgi:exonuclease VII large subunit